jgi:hypothetical protein
VKEIGVNSIVSYRLFTTKDTLGAMNLYSRTVDAFDAFDAFDAIDAIDDIDDIDDIDASATARRGFGAGGGQRGTAGPGLVAGVTR